MKRETMTKADLITILAEGTGLTKVETSAVIDGLIATVRFTLKEEGHFEIRGVGTFKVVERKARQIRNPQTGRLMQVPAKKSVSFRPSSDLKRYLNDFPDDFANSIRTRLSEQFQESLNQ